MSKPAGDVEHKDEELRFPRDMGCFGCSRENPNGLRLRFWRRGDRVVSRYKVPDRFHGAPGVTHGGIIATVFDEVSCCAVVFLHGSHVVTGELTVRYDAPVPVETEVEYQAWIADTKHPKYALVQAEATLDGKVVARSSGRFFYREINISAP